jgi:tetratricopeptide (TPR) repeat protein
LEGQRLSDDLPIEVARQGAQLWEQGKHYESISENQKAIKCYEEMMRISFPDPVVLNAIGYCHLLLNQTDQCKKVLNRALELDPENVEALHNLSMVMFDTDEFDVAEELARRGVGVDRSFSGHWLNLGKVLYATGRLEDAREDLATAIGLAPDRSEAHYFMALTQDKLGDIGQAHRSFLRAIELEDDSVMNLIGYGRFLLNMNQPEDAEKYLRRAVELEELNYIALSMLAESIIEQVKGIGEDPDNRIGDAMDHLNASLDLHLGYGMAWYNWGQIFILYRDWENAEQAFRSATEAECENTMAWALLSHSLDQLGRKTEAHDMFEEYRVRTGQEEGEE